MEMILEKHQTTTPRIDFIAPKAIHPENFWPRKKYRQKLSDTKKRYVLNNEYEKNSEITDKDQQKMLLEKTGYTAEQIDASADQNSIIEPRLFKKQEPSGSFARYVSTIPYQDQTLQATQNLYNYQSWSLWSDWSLCSQPCLSGSRMRRRNCVQPGLCEGSPYETQPCTPEICYWQSRQSQPNPYYSYSNPSQISSLYDYQSQSQYYPSNYDNSQVYPAYFFAQG